VRSPRIVKSVVINAVGVGLIGASWVLLGVLALGNKYLSPIPRNRGKGEYV
jgi:hypothetical protein